MMVKGVKRGDLHDLCIGGLLVCLTVLCGGRAAMVPDRGRDLPAAIGTQSVLERMSVQFFATRDAQAQAATQDSADDAAGADLSMYLQLHDTRDFRLRPMPPAAHECRS